MGKARADVEIFTDAGCQMVGVKASSWAAVVARKDGRGGIVEGSGLLKQYAGTFVAEAHAAANGMFIARREGLIGANEQVVIRCDNIEVCYRWRGVERRRPLDPRARAAFDIIREIKAELRCRVRFAHIKAHEDPARGDFPTLMNARADALCGRQLGTKRSRTEVSGICDGSIERLSAQLKRRARLRSVAEQVARLTGA